jgi:predicted nucleic acid-binding protein
MFFDTNIIINILSENPDEKVLEISSYYINTKTAYISEIVLMEMLSWNSLSKEDVEKLLKNILKLFKVKKHNREISLKTSEIRRLEKKVKLPDAIIAATAIVYGKKLFTNNLEDFKNISELDLYK